MLTRAKWTPPPRKYPSPNAEARGVMARSADVALVIPKGVKARPGKRSRTVEEDRWIDAALDYGCVACIADGNESRVAEYHHIVVGGRRLGHLFGFGLCRPGHHQDGIALGIVSRHPFKARFEARYGRELDILAGLKVRLGFFDSASYQQEAA